MNQENKKKSKKLIIKKITIAISIIFLLFMSFQYWKISARKRHSSQSEINKLENIESEIFDFSEDRSEDENFDESKFYDISLTELKEGGAEFIYQLLLRNQIQINSLKNQNQELKDEFAKYKSQEKANKIIFTYIDLRERFFAGENFSKTLESLETIAMLDKNFQDKFLILKENLEKFHGSKSLLKKFKLLIPEIIANKNNNSEKISFLQKIRNNLSKLIVIRKITSDATTTDGIIHKTEEFLEAENFSEAFNSFTLLEEYYQKISPEFFDELKAASEIQKVDDAILLYLKSSIN